MAGQHRSDFARYLNVRMAYGASFAPDGRRLAFLTDISGVSEVWCVPLDIHAADPAWPRQLTFTGERVLGAAFAPTQDRLVIGSDTDGNERTQLALLSGDGTGLSPLTDQPDVIHVFAGWQEDGTSSGGWSPDGTRLVYASNARDRRYFDIYIHPLDGAPRMVLQHDGTNYPAGFSPDGHMVLVSRVTSNVANQLLLLDLANRHVRPLTPEDAPPPTRHLAPQWSADGHGLYLLSDRGRQFMALAWLDLATGALTYLRDEQWDAEALALSPDGTRMALITNVEGYSRLELFDVAHGWEQRRALPLPPLSQGVIAQPRWSPDGTRLAFGFNPPDDAPDVWVWDTPEGVLWRATRSALGGLSRASFVAPSLVHYATFDRRQIPAFLSLPASEQRRPLPLVLWLHGGPESQFRPTFNPIIQYYVASGYAVLAPNVRGSTGYGHAFQSLDDVRQRMDSVADLAAAVRWLGSSGIADPQHIAVQGASYGGFMVLAAITTYPDLWAAAVDIVGIANFITFLEHTGPWRRTLREAEYGSLERDRAFLDSISPIHQVQRISAPLFVVHGANDPRVPVGEAEQIVAALRERGVPIEYLRFEDEGHGIVKRANRLVMYPAIARFLDAHLRPEA